MTAARDAVHVLPDDEFNRALVANVHPREWVNPVPQKRYHLVVLGAGTAGLVTAAGAAGLGAKVALIERHLLGGDCLNYGCVPSKALIRAARAAAAVRDAGRFGVHVPAGVRVDFPAVMQRMRRLRAGISPHDSARRLRELGVDVFLGEGRFSGAGTIQVGSQVLCFKTAVIATGARAAAPNFPGLREAGYLTNETVFSLTELPMRLAIIGGGPIGCELAQCFARFGARVSLFEMTAQILPREDGDASTIIAEALRQDGVELLTGSRIGAVRRSGAEKTIVYARDGRQEERTFDEILVGVGRQPNVEGLNLEAVGVEYDSQTGVRVDDKLRTTNRRIFAAGDVCSPYKFTHAADFLARIVIQNALFFPSARASRLTIPWCTYTEPEIAHVGLSERQARERGIAVDTYVQKLCEVDRAVLDGQEKGFAKVHVRAGTDRIVGATIVAAHAGDLISEISVAMAGGIGLKTLAGAIHPYPTQAEAIRKLGDQYNRSRLTPRVQSLLESWLSWTG